MCPFGDDDDDFDVNPIIDKSLEVNAIIVVISVVIPETDVAHCIQFIIHRLCCFM